MTGKMSRRLVVDADVARASGESIHPISSCCRNTLEIIRKVCHRIVMDRRLADEWNRHHSQFAKRWLASMRSKRKIIFLESRSLQNIESTLNEIPLSKIQLAAIQKDRHLLEIAVESDYIVISLDDRARSSLSITTQHVEKLRNLQWINPKDTDSLDWLKSGARKTQLTPKRKP